MFKVTRGKQDLSNCWDGRPWLKRRPELETVNKYAKVYVAKVVRATSSEGFLAASVVITRNIRCNVLYLGSKVK